MHLLGNSISEDNEPHGVDYEGNDKGGETVLGFVNAIVPIAHPLRELVGQRAGDREDDQNPDEAAEGEEAQGRRRKEIRRRGK